VLARRRHALAESTRRNYRQRLERELDAVIACTGDRERSIRSIMNTESGDHEHLPSLG